MYSGTPGNRGGEMSASVEIANPLDDGRWNNRLASSPQNSFFHTSNWARVLHESYDYHPVYSVILENGSLLALIPLMEVNSILTGRRGVSLPFTDYCDPISNDQTHLQSAIDCLRRYGKEADWKYIEFRGDGYFTDKVPCYGYYYGHNLSLSQDGDYFKEIFRDSTWRNIRKSQRLGIRVEISTSLESLSEFYRLNCLTRRVHGLPPQPFYFFSKINEHILSKGLGLVILASYNQDYIAGAVFFHFGDRAYYKFGASNRKFQQLRANNLLMWEAIRWYSEKGYRELCFGRTNANATGLRQFKNGWGARERIIKYYRYDTHTNRFLGSSEPCRECGYSILSRVPLPLLKAAGRLMYRHMG